MLSCAAGSLQLCPFHLSRGLNGPGHVKAHTTVPCLWLMFSEHDPLFPFISGAGDYLEADPLRKVPVPMIRKGSPWKKLVQEWGKQAQEMEGGKVVRFQVKCPKRGTCEFVSIECWALHSQSLSVPG